MSLHGFLNLIGLSRHAANYPEKVISAVGGFLGIFAILLASQWLLEPEIAVMIVPSMGASAVLLFAAPHALFSQPWNVIGGHALSALPAGNGFPTLPWRLLPALVYPLASCISPAVFIRPVVQRCWQQ